MVKRKATGLDTPLTDDEKIDRYNANKKRAEEERQLVNDKYDADRRDPTSVYRRIYAIYHRKYRDGMYNDMLSEAVEDPRGTHTIRLRVIDRGLYELLALYTNHDGRTGYWFQWPVQIEIWLPNRKDEVLITLTTVS